MASTTAWGTALAVGAGAALGALLRWRLGEALNGWHPSIPAGTLAANLLGGYLVGVAIAFFAQHAEVSEAARLFVITGVLGGLTTFSTFSAEVVSLLQHGRVGTALLTSGLHLGGSLLATAAGLATMGALTRNTT